MMWGSLAGALSGIGYQITWPAPIDTLRIWDYHGQLVSRTWPRSCSSRCRFYGSFVAIGIMIATLFWRSDRIGRLCFADLAGAAPCLPGRRSASVATIGPPSVVCLVRRCCWRWSTCARPGRSN